MTGEELNELRCTSIPNAIWEDDRISVGAKGVLGYLLSRPPDYSIKLVEVGEVLRVGPDKLKSLFRELLAAGYVVRNQARVAGAFKSHYAVSRSENAPRGAA